MGWFDNWKADDSVREIKHVRGAKIRKSLPKKQGPRYYDPGDPATHDLPQKPDREQEPSAGQTLTDELRFENLELDPETPTKHFIISGGTGSGKTQALQRILDRVLYGVRHGEKGFVTDSGGQFWESRSRKEDLLLNPFDGRSVLWNPFLEVEDEWDFDSLSEALIPEKKGYQSGPGDEWTRYARGLVSSLMKSFYRSGETNPRKVAELLQKGAGDPETLRPYLSGTPEEALLSPANERFFGSVVAVASLSIRPWSALAPDGDFSLRKWIRESGGGALFITYKEKQAGPGGLLTSLIGAWLGIAVTEALDLRPDFDRRIWFVMDELDSLGQVARLSDATTKGRKFGICVSAAIQSIAQLESTYGPAGAQTLLSTLSSKLIFRQGSFKDAEFWANELGQREIIERTESSTKGSGSDSTTTAFTQKVVQAVLPSQLSELPDRVCYSRFPGMEGIFQVEFPIRKYKPIRPAFLPPGEPEPEPEEAKEVHVFTPSSLKDEETGERSNAWNRLVFVVGWAIIAWGVFYFGGGALVDGLYHRKPKQWPVWSKPLTPEARRECVGHAGNWIVYQEPSGQWYDLHCPAALVHPIRRPAEKPRIVHTVPRPAPNPPMDPVMSLPIWNGPWPSPWKFACAYEWNRGKWFAVNRPVLFDGHLRDPRTGMSRFATDRVRIECPK